MNAYINTYCLSGFVVVYERCSAECTIIQVITGICLVLVMGEIKFLRKFFFVFSPFFLFYGWQEPIMPQEEKLLKEMHLLLNVIWKIIWFCPAAVIKIIID